MPALEPIVGLVFSPTGNRLVAVGPGVVLWDFPLLSSAAVSYDEYFDPEQPLSLEVVFSPDGRWMAVSDLSGKVNLWEAADGSHLLTLEFQSVEGLSISPDGTLLAAAADGRLYLWGVPASETNTPSPQE